MLNFLHLVAHIATILIAAWIIHRLWTTMSRFGALIQSAYKIIGAGIFFISLNIIEEAIEHVTGFGTATFLRENVHDFAHSLISLAGFSLLAWGIIKLIGVRGGEE